MKQHINTALSDQRAPSMTEIKSLVAKAHRSLEAAQCMHEGSFFDVSVSRAYYAMFYVARAALLTKGVAEASHEGLIADFEKHFVQDGTLPLQLQGQLAEALGQRYRSDYDVLEETTVAEAEQIMGMAKKFLDTVSAFLVKEPQI
jgi:uncharacterized protein